METYKIIKSRRLELGLTLKDVAKALGVAESTVSRYESSDIQNMGIDKIESLSRVLKCSPGYLMGWTDDVPATPQVEPLIELYRIPVVGRVAAGEPIFSEENIEGYIPYGKNPKGHMFCVHVEGHSMEPEIRDGDLIIIDKDSVWDDGDIVMVTINGNEGTCKRIRKYAEGIRLIPLNPAYDPMDYNVSQVEQLPVTVVGKVIESRKKW